MKTNNSTSGFIGAGALAAVASSLCCIVPVLALLAGAGGVASAFSWLDPVRPYLIGFTVLVLGFAWYQKLKPEKEDKIACDCAEDGKPPFWQSKKFLAIITVFAGLMLAFPYYADKFYPSHKDREIVVVNAKDVQTVQFTIEGMTCSGCATHVENEVYKLDGIISAEASYEKGSAKVEFDRAGIGVAEIEEAINATGYKVTKTKRIENGNRH